jgi:hypothetical protein
LVLARISADEGAAGACVDLRPLVLREIVISTWEISFAARTLVWPPIVASVRKADVYVQEPVVAEILRQQTNSAVGTRLPLQLFA